MKIGKLFGVGLGPGDPELMTLKADRLIRSASVIAYPTLEKGDSFARSIAELSIPKDAKHIEINIPMSVDRAPAQAAYDQGASDISAVLRSGQDVVVLCEGDPFFYGSFMYLFSRLSDEFEVEIVPGVTSVTACAAALQRPLTARNEVLTILPGPMPESELRERIQSASSVAIMKVGRHLPKIRAIIDDLGLTDRAGYVERASLPNQVVSPLTEAPEKAPYFSMILIFRGKDPWL